MDCSYWVYDGGMRRERPDFVCDAMLGGLARWLRAAGYDAEFACDVTDHHLVSRALATGAVLLSSDGQIFERNVIKHKTAKAVFVPPGLGKLEQLDFVLRELRLPIRPQTRCMTCGGSLEEVERQSIRGEAPPKAYAACDRFWRCGRCGKLFWRGTHWLKITARLERIGGTTAGERERGTVEPGG